MMTQLLILLSAGVSGSKAGFKYAEVRRSPSKAAYMRLRGVRSIALSEIADESYDTFSIACRTPGGDTLYVIERPHEPVRRPQEEIDSVLELARRNWTEATGSPAGFEWEPPEFYPSIASLAVDGEGRLWVGSGHDNTVFHVFDHSGEYLHDCTLMMPRWQDPGRWAVDINPYGILANPRNPELYPLVYMLRETAGPAADQRQATP